jgi:O-antigen/teichoic acid export membrane protein
MLIGLGQPSSAQFVLVWAGAGLIGGVVGAVALKLPSRPVSVRDAVAQSDLASRLSLDNLVTQLAQQGIGYAVAAVAGVAAAGSLRAAQTVFLPVAVLSLGVQSAITPELVRVRARSLRQMRKLMNVIVIGLTGFAAVYFVAALLCPDSLGKKAFGVSWSGAAPLLPYIGAAAVVGAGVTTAAVAGLRALADARRTLQARSVAVVLTIVTAVIGSVAAGDKGASVAILISGVGQAVIWRWQFHAAYRAERSHAVVARVHSRWQSLVASTGPRGDEDELWVQSVFNSPGVGFDSPEPSSLLNADPPEQRS